MHTLTTEQGIKIQVTDEQYAQLVPSHKKWRAKQDEEYFFVALVEEIGCSCERGTLGDNYRYLIGNYFKTKEEAEQHLAYQKALGTLTHAIYERNAGWEADWVDKKQDKWRIWYDHCDSMFMVSWSTAAKEMNNFYCASKEIAESITKDFPEELKVVFNVK